MPRFQQGGRQQLEQGLTLLLAARQCGSPGPKRLVLTDGAADPPPQLSGTPGSTTSAGSPPPRDGDAAPRCLALLGDGPATPGEVDDDGKAMRESIVDARKKLLADRADAAAAAPFFLAPPPRARPRGCEAAGGAAGGAAGASTGGAAAAVAVAAPFFLPPPGGRLGAAAGAAAGSAAIGGGAARAGDAERGGDFRRMDLGTRASTQRLDQDRIGGRPAAKERKRESFEPARALRYGCAQLLCGI